MYEPRRALIKALPYSRAVIFPEQDVGALTEPFRLGQQTLGEVSGEEVDRQAEDVQGPGFVGVG